MKAIILGIALIVFVPFKAFGLGEIFKIETTGLEFCGDLDVHRFNPRNNVDLWVQVVSEEELLVSRTFNFAAGTTFSMFGLTYLTNETTAAFVANAVFDDDSFATIRGTARLNRNTGAVASLTGTFIQSGVFETGCFSTGTFTSKRIA
jgi:hypothetical protein